MNIHDVRVRNARTIAKELGGQSALADILGKSESQLSQIMGKNPSRKIGNKVARQIEEAGDKEKNWLDVEHVPESNNVYLYRRRASDKAMVSEPSADDYGPVETTISDYALVPRFNIRAGMGPGEPVQSEQVTDSLAFRADWLQKLGIPEGHAACVRCIGDSMEPTLKDGDIALLDLTAIKTTDGVYALSRPAYDDHKEVIIKRLEWRTNGELWVLSDNKSKYPEADKYEPGFDLAQLNIIGRVIWAGGDVF